MTPPVPRWLCAIDRGLLAVGAIPATIYRIMVAVADPLIAVIWYVFLVGLPVMCVWLCLIALATLMPGIPAPPFAPVGLDPIAALFAVNVAFVCGFFSVCQVAQELEDRYPDWRNRCQEFRAGRGSP